MELESVDLDKIRTHYNPYNVQYECDLHSKYEQKKIEFLLARVDQLTKEKSNDNENKE